MFLGAILTALGDGIWGAFDHSFTHDVSWIRQVVDCQSMSSSILTDFEIRVAYKTMNKLKVQTTAVSL